MVHQHDLSSPVPLVAPGSKQLNPLLAAYLRQLAAKPLLTKAITSGCLSFVQELLAAKLAGAPPPPLSAKDKTGIAPVDWIKRNQKAFKLAAYGGLISAPLAHFLLGRLQAAFAGKTAPSDKVKMILAQNLLLAPIQNTVYIASLAIIGGATSLAQVQGAVKASFLRIMKLTWVISPSTMVIAQRFLAPEQWVPFFTFVNFLAGSWINTQVKKKQIAAAREQLKKDADEKAEK